MYSSTHSLPYLGVLLVAVVGNQILDDCLSSTPKYTMNVVLLEDDTYEWSLPYVQAAVLRAIEIDKKRNNASGKEPGFSKGFLRLWSSKWGACEGTSGGP